MMIINLPPFSIYYTPPWRALVIVLITYVYVNQSYSFAFQGVLKPFRLSHVKGYIFICNDRSTIDW